MMAQNARLTVSYQRISEDQNGEGAGVERQAQDCAKMADAKGRKIDRSYADNDISALDESKVRPEFEQLVSDVEVGKIDTIIVWHMDRLCVRMDDWAKLLKPGRQHGVTIAAVHGISIDLSDPTGVAVAQILISIAEMERRHKGNRQRRANRQRAEMGLPTATGGLRPFGYQKDRMTMIESEAEALRQAAQDILAGGSVVGLVRQWNEAGLPTVRGGKWSYGTIHSILTSPRYAGLVEYQGKIVGDAQWPAILDREVWERLQTRLANGGTGDGKREAHRLSGLLYCHCGAPMGAGGQKDSYRCDRQRGGCGKVSRTFKSIETFVIGEFLKRTEGKPLSIREVGDTTALEAERAEILRRIDALRIKYGTGKISDDDYFPVVEILRNRQDEIESEIDRIKEDQFKLEAVSDLEPITITSAEIDMPSSEAQITGQRELLKRFIERVTVGPASKRGRAAFPGDGVEITWRD